MKKLNEDYKTIKDHNKSYVPLPTTSKFSTRSDRATLRETSSWTLQASASTSNVNVHHSTVYGSFKRFKVKASSLMTAQICKDRTKIELKKDFWNNGSQKSKGQSKGQSEDVWL